MKDARDWLAQGDNPFFVLQKNAGALKAVERILRGWIDEGGIPTYGES